MSIVEINGRPRLQDLVGSQTHGQPDGSYSSSETSPAEPATISLLREVVRRVRRRHLRGRLGAKVLLVESHRCLAAWGLPAWSPPSTDG